MATSSDRCPGIQRKQRGTVNYIIIQLKYVFIEIKILNIIFNFLIQF